MTDLAGKVVAFIGTGSESDRAIVIACAEAGADMALATTSRAQAQEFGMASIANEVWVLGREQSLTVMDARDPADAASFADQVWDRFGRCDAAITNPGRTPVAPFEELSLEEFEADLHEALSPVFLATQAFGRLMARAHGGLILHCFVEPTAAEELDAGQLAARSGAHGRVAAARAAWASDGVDAGVVTLPASAAGADADTVAARRVLERIRS